MPALFRYIASMILLSLALTACSGDDEPGIDEDGIPAYAVYDIVTLSTTSPQGSEFTMQIDGDSPEITYTAAVDFSQSKTIKPGRRMLICYNRVDGATYTSGKIRFYGYSLMNNTNQAAITAESAPAFMKPIKIMALWRTGNYVNLQGAIYVFKASQPDKFDLTTDASTLQDPYPKLYINYENAEDNDGENLYNVRASFDISKIWQNPDYRGVDIYYNTSSGLQYTRLDK